MNVFREGPIEGERKGFPLFASSLLTEGAREGEGEGGREEEEEEEGEVREEGAEEGASCLAFAFDVRGLY